MVSTVEVGQVGWVDCCSACVGSGPQQKAEAWWAEEDKGRRYQGTVVMQESRGQRRWVRWGKGSGRWPCGVQA